MATRSGRLCKPDSQGQFVRQLGWKITPSGKRVQHKFRLGTDRREAQRRDDRLRQLWEQIENAQGDDQKAWNEVTLEIAKQLAKGAEVISLPPSGDGETDTDYASRLQETQNRFPALRFSAMDEASYARGVGDRAYSLRDVLVMADPKEDFLRQLKGSDVLCAPPLQPESRRGSWRQGVSRAAR